MADKSNWKASLAAILRTHNGVRRGGSVASFKTQEKRANALFACFKQIRELGYKLNDVRQLKGKHIKALCDLWLKQNIGASTIQNRLSVLRVFTEWSSVGKAGMVLGSNSGEYVPVGRASRSSINTTDKSWTGKGIDPIAKINEVRAINPRIACQLDLQRVFGLRPLEARRLKPVLADKGTYLDVSLGTKGKRPRVEAIATAEQREVLDLAKTFVAASTDSICTPGKTLKQAEGEYYRLLSKVGVTKKQLGVTSYANRHQFANDRYEKLTGVPSPVRGGGPVSKDLSDLANLDVAESLGHSRPGILKIYIGSK